VNAEVPSSLLQRIVAPLLHHTCPALHRNKQRFVPSDRQSGSFEEPGRNVRIADQNEAAGAADATVLTFE